VTWNCATDSQIANQRPDCRPRFGTVNRLTRFWTSRLGERAVVQVQNPIELPEQDSEPEPDVTLLRPRADFYAAAHPLAIDVLLLIEIADTSLLLDRRVKIPLYARAGVREAWLVDLTTDQVEVHRAPSGNRYREHRIVERGQPIVPEAFPDVTVDLADLLG
jgi:Uma2 family endonuclease